MGPNNDNANVDDDIKNEDDLLLNDTRWISGINRIE